MNYQRRKALNAVKDQIEALTHELQNILDEEQDSFDNMPESLQASERGEASESAIYNIEAALNDLSNSIDYIDSAAE